MPAAGDWLMTIPAGTVALGAVELPSPSENPAVARAFVAAVSVRPTTFGTVNCCGPEETTRVTAVSATTCVPAAGDWLITNPAATVELGVVVNPPTIRLAPVIAAV